MWESNVQNVRRKHPGSRAQPPLVWAPCPALVGEGLRLREREGGGQTPSCPAGPTGFFSGWSRRWQPGLSSVGRGGRSAAHSGSLGSASLLRLHASRPPGLTLTKMLTQTLKSPSCSKPQIPAGAGAGAGAGGGVGLAKGASKQPCPPPPPGSAGHSCGCLTGIDQGPEGQGQLEEARKRETCLSSPT